MSQYCLGNREMSQYRKEDTEKADRIARIIAGYSHNRSVDDLLVRQISHKLREMYAPTLQALGHVQNAVGGEAMRTWEMVESQLAELREAPPVSREPGWYWVRLKPSESEYDPGWPWLNDRRRAALYNPRADSQVSGQWYCRGRFWEESEFEAIGRKLPDDFDGE